MLETNGNSVATQRAQSGGKDMLHHESGLFKDSATAAGLAENLRFHWAQRRYATAACDFTIRSSSGHYDEIRHESRKLS